jgi:hypothetical protein
MLTLLRFVAVTVVLGIFLSGCPPPGDCCKCCDPDTSIPCGDSCISKSDSCHQGSGCACSC